MAVQEYCVTYTTCKAPLHRDPQVWQPHHEPNILFIHSCRRLCICKRPLVILDGELGCSPGSASAATATEASQASSGSSNSKKVHQQQQQQHGHAIEQHLPGPFHILRQQTTKRTWCKRNLARIPALTHLLLYSTCSRSGIKWCSEAFIAFP